MTKYYTITQAHQKLGCSIHLLYHYHKMNLIQFHQIPHPKYKKLVAGIDEPTLQYLNQQLNPHYEQQNLITIQQAVQLNRIANYSCIKQLLQKAHIQPVQSAKTYRFKKHRLFNAQQVKQVCDNYLYPKNYRKFHHLTINTNQRDNPQIDLNKTQFVHRFKINSHATVMQWIEYQRIPYHLNDHYELFFTPQDVEWFAMHYQKIPNGYISNETLAHHLNRKPQTVSLWAKQHHIPNYRVIGYKKVFYQPSNAKIIQHHFQKGAHENVKSQANVTISQTNH